jgi:hypothetical protein
MERIPCVQEVRGEGTRVYLAIVEDEVSANDLRELGALYRRYDGDISQLSRLQENAG